MQPPIRVQNNNDVAYMFDMVGRLTLETFANNDTPNGTKMREKARRLMYIGYLIQDTFDDVVDLAGLLQDKES